MGLLTPCFVPGGGTLYGDCPEGQAFALFESCPGDLLRMKLIAALIDGFVIS